MPMMPARPLLLTLGFDRATFGRLDGLRARYFPPERNQIPAHLSLFHQLPGQEQGAIEDTLARAARSAGPIPLTFTDIKRMGRGLMLPVQATGLAPLRASLARSFAPWLTDQDRQPFHPHVTIMNKAERAEVDSALDHLRGDWQPWTGRGERLLLWRYLGGPWEAVEEYDLTGQTGPIEPPEKEG